MTLDELNKLFRDTLNNVLTISEVIKYHPNAPRPPDDYATVNISELTRIGFSDKGFSPDGEDLDEKIVMQYTAMVSINFYRGEAEQQASIFNGYMYSNSVVESFNSNGVGFTRASSVRDISALIDQGVEIRAQIDIFVAFELTPIQTFVTGVDAVRVVGDVDNGATVVEEIDITIEP